MVDIPKMVDIQTSAHSNSNCQDPSWRSINAPRVDTIASSYEKRGNAGMTERDGVEGERKEKGQVKASDESRGRKEGT